MRQPPPAHPDEVLDSIDQKVDLAKRHRIIPRIAAWAPQLEDEPLLFVWGTHCLTVEAVFFGYPKYFGTRLMDPLRGRVSYFCFSVFEFDGNDAGDHDKPPRYPSKP